MMRQAIKTTALTVLGSVFAAGAALAQAAQAVPSDLPVIGQPTDGATGFQPAATSLASDIHWLDHFILVIITAIVIFVLVLIAIVIVRYNEKANPTPAKFTHNSPVEVAWTVIPIVILVVIGAFSLPALFKQQEIPTPDILVKVTGNQWYWSYDYPKEGIGFDSYMLGSPATITDADTKAGVLPYIHNAAMDKLLARYGYKPDEFRLAADNPVVLPVGKTIVMQVTGADVIHSWTVPAFGVKQDAVPGRIAQLWFKADKEGVYFGQCSELCGKDHAFMPITVKIVSQKDYDAWLVQAKKEFASNDAPVVKHYADATPVQKPVHLTLASAN